MNIQPYLFFNGRCEEAIEFYRDALGAEVLGLMRFKENPEAGDSCNGSAANGDKVMHACFRVGESTLMASDGYCSGQTDFQGFSLSIAAADGTEAERLFTALSEGGQITMPLGKTFFASHFGMLTDRFGVAWMINVPA